MKKSCAKDPELCRGCELYGSGKIPEFHNEEEMAAFWGNHSPLDFPEDFEESDIEVMDLRPKKVPISLRLDPELKKDIKKLAHIKKVKYQTMIQGWIREKLKEEEKVLLSRVVEKRR